MSPGKILGQIRKEIDPGASTVEVIPLAGDASNRSYFRLNLLSGNRGRSSLVLMVLAEPEPFKQSEEKESGAVKMAELPFLNVQKYLAGSGIRVPKLYFHDREEGLIYLEDLGDRTLEAEVRNGSEDRKRHFYQRAVDDLIEMQNCRETDLRCVAFDRSYNQALLVWEFEHFLEYGVEGKIGRKVGSEDAALFKETFAKLASRIAAEPQVFVHRDYHSRNLMVQGETLRLIDFQDALMGPPQYDLASLLRDAYVTLSESFVDELVGYYLAQREKRGSESRDPDPFRYLFDLVSLQRNMKAAGRFVFIDQVKNNPSFLKYVPKALGDISRNLNKYPELHRFRDALARYLPELA